MARISLKILLIASISSLVFFLSSDKTKSCGPDYEYDNFYKIFEDELFNDKKLTPFLLTEYIFKETDEDGSVGPRFDNLKAWLDYFENRPSIDDLEKFIYQSSISDFDSVLKYYSTPGILKNNPLFSGDKKRFLSAVEYLKFAKLCEPYVSEFDPWNPPDKDINHMDSLLETAVSSYNRTKNVFLKERYAFQAVRLAHYSGQYEKTLFLFDKFFKNPKTKSLMYYWSLGHCAGATRSLGNSAKANVLFSRVFDNCPSKSRQSVLSFRYRNDSLLTETLKLCDNDHDKVVVYTIAAYKSPFSESTNALSEIYKLEPDSPYLILILSRHISFLEQEKLPSKSYWFNYRNYLSENDNYRLYNIDSSFSAVVKNIAGRNKTPNAYLWNYAAGYISALQGETLTAEKYFYEAKRLCPKEDMDFVKRVQIAELICKVNSINKITENTEAWLNRDIRWLKETSSLKKLRAEDALIYIMNTLAKHYWVQGDTIKSHLCFGISGINKPWEKFFTSDNPANYDLSLDYHLQPLEKIYRTIQENDGWDGDNKSDWTKFLVDNYYYTLKSLDIILAKKYIAKGLFNEAVEKLKSQKDEWDYFGTKGDGTELFIADPFTIHINDCHDCDFIAEKKTSYTLLGFCKRMIELKQLAAKESNPENSARLYFELANGYYNITFYGNSWMASCFNSRGELSWGYSEGQNYDLYDCSRAEENYVLAAKRTNDKEFSAMCYFMAAKCEQNTFYNNEDPGNEYYFYRDYDKLETIKFDKYKTYFKYLVNNYSDTKFIKEALKECKYFNYFVTNN